MSRAEVEGLGYTGREVAGVEEEETMLGSGLNLVTTVIGFGMSATFIVFVCTRLLCRCIRSTDSRATPLDLELRSEVYQVRRSSPE